MSKYKEKEFVRPEDGFVIQDELRFHILNELAEANQLKKLELMILNDKTGMWGNAQFKQMVAAINWQICVFIIIGFQTLRLEKGFISEKWL